METTQQTAPLVVEKTYKASAERIWQALTDRDKLQQWSFDMDDFKPEVGFEFHFMGENEGRTFRHTCVVREAIVGKKLSYSWRYDNYPGDSLVVWELFSEEPELTTVRLTHTGLETFPASMKDFGRENFSKGWNELVGSLLKKFVEEGA